MTLANFVHLDPAQRAKGRSGIGKGGREQKAVWDEFAHDPKRLHEIAALIRTTIDLPPEKRPPAYDEDDITEAPEGRLLTALHRWRERNHKIVDQRKKQGLKEGALRCDACKFDFGKVYGERGNGFIEAHHMRPLHTLSEGSITRAEDLALLCANCHRMIHRARPWLSMEELKELVMGDKGRPPKAAD
jgi:5-methylcytosine-specific restriction protein A